MKRFMLLLVCCCFICGCATAISMRKISSMQIGMTKTEVIEKLGKPYRQRAAFQRPDGAIEEAWEYNNYDPFNYAANKWTGNVTYWVTFINDKLVFYGQPGDFGSAQSDAPSVNVQQVVNTPYQREEK